MRAGRIVSVAAAMLVLAGAASAAKKPKSPKAPPPRYLFGGVSWLVPADTAVAQLVRRGYESVPQASDSLQIVLRGRLFEHDAIITGNLDEQRRLLRWVVLISSHGEAFPYPGMREVFDDVVHEAETRYGTPRTVEEKYGFPYEKGDGREDWGLRDGKVVIRWGWASDSGDRLTVAMDSSVEVVLTYECREWETFTKRRQTKRASDL
jgi:hypothetical protein